MYSWKKAHNQTGTVEKSTEKALVVLSGLVLIPSVLCHDHIVLNVLVFLLYIESQLSPTFWYLARNS